MARTFDFIAMTSSAERILDVLSEFIGTSCAHSHKASGVDPEECPNVILVGLELAAVEIAELIDKGELS